MADHPLIDMFGETTNAESNVLQEIGAIGSASGASSNVGYNPASVNQHAVAPGMMPGQSTAMSGLPQTGAARSYQQVGGSPQISHDRTKLQQIIPNDYPSAVSSIGGMTSLGTAQYAAMNSRIPCPDQSNQQQLSASQQHRYSGMVSRSHYQAQQYSYPNPQQYEGIQQYPGVASIAQQSQQARPINAPQQLQQYPNSWASGGSQAGQSHAYITQHQRMPVPPQQQHHYVDYNTQALRDPQSAGTHQRAAMSSHYPGVSSSQLSNQTHIPRPALSSSVSVPSAQVACSTAPGQMSMYHPHSGGYTHNNTQQNNMHASYSPGLTAGVRAAQQSSQHPSMPQQQQISGYTSQTSQPQQRPSNSYYNSSGLGSRPTTPQQQQQTYTHMQSGQYTSVLPNHASNQQTNEAARMMYHQQSSSSTATHNPSAIHQNINMGQNTYYPPQQNNHQNIMSPGQQFRPPAQLSPCPPDLHGQAQPMTSNNSMQSQQFRSAVMSPRRPTPPASGTISPMPPHSARTPDRFITNNPSQSSTPHSQGFTSPHQLMSPNGETSPAASQQTSLQQLEQMVMPASKIVDKSETGIYSHINVVSNSGIQNGSSPLPFSSGPVIMQQTPPPQYQISRQPMMDSSVHPTPQTMNTNNNSHSNYQNSLNAVPPTVSTQMLNQQSQQPNIPMSLPAVNKSSENHQLNSNVKSDSDLPVPSLIFDNIAIQSEKVIADSVTVARTENDEDLSDSNVDYLKVKPPTTESHSSIASTTSSPISPTAVTSVKVQTPVFLSPPDARRSPKNQQDTNVISNVPLISDGIQETIEGVIVQRSMSPSLQHGQEKMLSQPPLNKPNGLQQQTLLNSTVNQASPQLNIQQSSQMLATAVSSHSADVSHTVPVSSVHQPNSAINQQVNLGATGGVVRTHAPNHPMVHPQHPGMSPRMPLGPPQLRPSSHYAQVQGHPTSPTTLMPPNLIRVQGPGVMTGPPHTEGQYSQQSHKSHPVPPLALPEVMTPQQRMYEVQKIQTQIQSYCQMPPTPQLNQQISELQDKIKLLQREQNMPPHGPPPPSQHIIPQPVAQNQPAHIHNQMTPSEDCSSVDFPVTSCSSSLPLDSVDSNGQKALPKKKGRGRKHQDKANRIVMEAVAKAQAAGNVDIPKVFSPLDGNQAGEVNSELPPGEEKKKVKKRKPRTPKIPKEPTTAKSPTKRSRKKKKDVEIPELPPVNSLENSEVEANTQTSESSLPAIEVENVEEKEGKPKRRVSRSPRASNSPRQRTRFTPGRRKPLKLPINFGKKKKRNRGGSSDEEDVEVTPPPSPKVDEEAVQKRRSTRNTKRKKYTDDIDMNLLEETIDDSIPNFTVMDDVSKIDETVKPSTTSDSIDAQPQQQQKQQEQQPVLIKPSQFYKTLLDDEMIVEKILNHRMGTRVIEYDGDEELDDDKEKDENIEAKISDQKPCDVSNEDLKVEDKDIVDVDSDIDKSKKLHVNEQDSETAQESLPEKVVCETSKQVDDKSEEESKIVDTECTEIGKQESEKTDEDKDQKAETKVHSETIEIEEYYVKYKNFSYLHCEWKTQEELERGDKRVAGKLKRYKQKRSQASFLDDLDEEPFNPLYLEVDRVIDISEGHVDENGTASRHFLVKWQGLPYEESTWELEQDVDSDKIKQFLNFRIPAPPEKRKLKKRPKSSEWKKREHTREYKNFNILRDYQLEGVNWLTFCYYNGQNCILADEMGLGKTIQSITFLVELEEYGITGPYLVIAPLSTISNWQREFESWSDMNVIVYHGSTASRNMIQEYEMYYKDEKDKKIQDVYKFQVIITTFEIVITDVLELREIPWRCCIIDEAHRLKNRNCKLLEGLRLIEMDHRVLLTGTPLQNNVEELFSLLNFLEPVRFSSQETFLIEFGDLKTEGQVEKLQSILKPMMLRRLKEDVEKTLAPKEETIVEVELTNIQKKYYRAILERNFAFLSKGSVSNSNVPNLMNTMMELRKCCIHPYLIKGAEEQIMIDYRQKHDDEDDATFHAMVQASGKMVLLNKLLPKLKDNGHRVLIFSQMVRCLDLLEDYLVHKRYLFERIDGRVRGNLRQAAIDRFSKPDSDRFAFLLCTRAGGLGINLTAADTVIIFDSDWNPQNDLQAQARCHRIGQVKQVKIYRLICRNTYEREMFDKASLKLGLDKAVLQSMNSSNKEGLMPTQQLTKKEIEDLLKKGAYGAIMEDDNAGDQFCEEDIDQILQRRTQVIQLESGVKGSTFAKASFSASESRTDIDIDDPEFWQKWAKKADVDMDTSGKNELIIKEPRRRTQTRRYGDQDHMMELSELESSDDDDSGLRGGRNRNRNRSNKKGRFRSPDEDYIGVTDPYPGIWGRTECFKVERGLLTFGWGRWREILAHAYFKRNMTEKFVEDISRAVLIYCSRYYRGDDQVKSFILDLITPSEDGQVRPHMNHSEDTVLSGLVEDDLFQFGLSVPVPRGRKARKMSKKERYYNDFDELQLPIDWSDKLDPELQLTDAGYKKHLQRHANKILLRVRTLYYIKQEVIGSLALQISEGVFASDLPIPAPCPDGDPPVFWWDEEADKSLLVGIYKHGYEKYNVMRQDPTLCFLSRCGPPDGAALLAEISDVNDDFMDSDKVSTKDDIEDEAMSPSSPSSNHHSQGNNGSSSNLNSSDKQQDQVVSMSDGGKLMFPSVAEINTRLRRIITSYQRNHKKIEMKNAQRVKRLEKREKIEAAFREREMQKRQLQQRRWSRREEADFYKAISAFGVVYLPDQQRYDWNKFKAIGRLDKKFDDTLTEYFKAFYAMCKRVCGKKLNRDEEQFPLMVEPITEERASRCLQRIDLLNKLRETILNHTKLDERLKLCQPSMDLPDWWICGKHDKDLLKGCAKHGLYRTDFHLLHDPSLSFKDVFNNLSRLKSGTSMNLRGSGPPSDSETGAVTSSDDPVSFKNEITELMEQKLESILKQDDKNLAFKETHADEHEMKSGDVKNEDGLVCVKSECGDDDDDDKNQNGSDKKVIKTETKEESCKSSSAVENEKSGNLDETKEEADDGESVKRTDATFSDNDKQRDGKRDETDVDDVESSKCDDVENGKKSKSDESGDVKDGERETIEGDKTMIKTDQHTNELKELQASKESKGSKASDKLKTSLEGIVVKLKQENEELLKDDDDRLDTMSQDSVTTMNCFNDDTMSQCSFSLEFEGVDPTVSHLLHNQSVTGSNSLRWPKEKVLQLRLEHVCHAIEKNEWPSPRQIYLSYTSGSGVPGSAQSAASLSSRSPTPSSITRSSTPQQHERLSSTPEQIQQQQQQQQQQQHLYRSSLPESLKHHDLFGLSAMAQLDQYAMSIKQSQDNLNMNMQKRRGKKRRRIDVEAERAKLRALLSQSLQVAMSATPGGSSFSRSLDDMRRSFPSLDNSQLTITPATSSSSTSSKFKTGKQDQPSTTLSTPPPAHQHSKKMSASVPPTETLDLSKKPSSNEISSSTSGVAMDLSSSGNTCNSNTVAVSSGVGVGASISITPLSKPISLLANRNKFKQKCTVSSMLNGEISPASVRTKPSIDDLALNLQLKKKKKMMKEETLKVNETKKEERKISGTGDVDHSGAKSTLYPIDAAAQFLSKPGYHSSATAASLLSEYKLASSSSSFPFSARGTNERSNSPGDPVSDYLESKRHKKRRPKVDPQLLDINEVTGDENISVVNRLTGKRLTGSKAPTLRELPLWLDQNPMFDVEAKWSQVVTEKGKLPEKLRKRVIGPMEKKKKLGIYSDYTSPLVANSTSTVSSLLSTPTSNSIAAMSGLGMGSLPLLSGFPTMKGSSSGSNAAANAAAAAAAASSSMFLPFGGLANLGLAANPFFNLAGYGFPNMPGMSAPEYKSSRSSSSSKSLSSDKKSSHHVGSKSSSSSKSSSRNKGGHGMLSSPSSSNPLSSSAAAGSSSLPFLFPAPGLMYNPLALGNFNLPQNMPSSFASLAQSGLLNSLVVPATATAATTTTPSPSFATSKPSTPQLSTSTLASHPLMQDDSDDESLKSLMGNHDDDDFPDDDEFDQPANLSENSKVDHTPTPRKSSESENVDKKKSDTSSKS